MTGQMSAEELHAVLDTVRDGDVIEGVRDRWTSSGPVMVDDKRVCGLVMLRYSSGDLPTDLVSVRVVERARPDWAADDVAIIRSEVHGFSWRLSADADWESASFYTCGTTEMIERLDGIDVRVVARFEQAQP